MCAAPAGPGLTRPHPRGHPSLPRQPVKAPLLCLSFLLLAAPGRGADPYAQQVDAARTRRAAALTRPDGWLTLVGLHFLDPGPNTLGSAPGNRVVLAAGPARLGTADLSDAGVVTFTPFPGAGAQVDGQPAAAAQLRPEGEGVRPTVVSAGTLSVYAIRRGSRLALRVKDSAAERRTRFLGLDYFPTDPSWRIVAQWVPFSPPRRVEVTNVLGNVSMEEAPGKAVFERDGRTYELLPLAEGPGEPLFFILGDATSDGATYHMRFLDADPPSHGTVVLDFNLAENPPCAFTPFATCPLPPKGNRLGLAITAGEKAYRGAHD